MSRFDQAGDNRYRKPKSKEFQIIGDEVLEKGLYNYIQ